jgi:hypothetical protein
VLATSIIRAASTSETSVNFYQTTRSNNPEDSHLDNRGLDNLKSHKSEWSILATSPYDCMACCFGIGRDFRRGQVELNHSRGMNSAKLDPNYLRDKKSIALSLCTFLRLQILLI